MMRSILWSRTFVRLALCHFRVMDYQEHLKLILKNRLDLLENFPTDTLQTRCVLDMDKEFFILENFLSTLQNAESRRIFPQIDIKSEGLKLFEHTIIKLKNNLCSQFMMALSKQVGCIAKWQALNDSVRYFEGKSCLMRQEADGAWQSRQKKLLEKLKRKQENQKQMEENGHEPEEGELMLSKKRKKSPQKSLCVMTRASKKKLSK